MARGKFAEGRPSWAGISSWTGTTLPGRARCSSRKTRRGPRDARNCALFCPDTRGGRGLLRGVRRPAGRPPGGRGERPRRRGRGRGKKEKEEGRRTETEETGPRTGQNLTEALGGGVVPCGFALRNAEFPLPACEQPMDVFPMGEDHEEHHREGEGHEVT